MFGYLEGKLVGLTPTHTYLDVAGVGYDIQITLNTYELISGKEACLLYTHLQVREDGWTLYGFATESERETFRKLLSISGIGSGTSRLILSSLTSQELSRIVANGDSKALEKVKGVGGKTAQRIILELKGKLPDAVTTEFNILPHNTIESDALNALLSLGITKVMAESAIKKAMVLTESGKSGVEDVIKTALKNL